MAPGILRKRPKDQKPKPSKNQQGFGQPTHNQNVITPTQVPINGYSMPLVHRYPENAYLPWASTNQLVHGPPLPPRQYQPQYLAARHMSHSQPNLPLLNQGIHQQQAQAWNQGAALCDRIQNRMSRIITAMDDDEDVTQLLEDEEAMLEPETPRDLILAPQGRGVQKARPKKSLMSNYFSKVWLYSNSRLPPHLPPFKAYIATYPLLNLAARYSLNAYYNRSPASSNNSSSSSLTPIQIPASLRLGTKAMLLAMHPLDTSNTVVLAIRGSANFADWAVNFRPVPDSPGGFLDDPGNLVHSGFLAVAKAMLGPIAARLRTLIQEDPDRKKSSSLLLTGHSAGGAVASLLFCHMLSQNPAVMSELKGLAGLFRRIHCITFGTPPVSLLPLQKPTIESSARDEAKRWRKSLFFAFINEGDPVVRADPAMVRSLLFLYTSPTPTPLNSSAPPIWKVPPNTLSNAGRLIVLRPVPKLRQKKRSKLLSGRASHNSESQARGDNGAQAGEIGRDRIEAVLTSDEQLRGIVFGDPLLHNMKLYAKRIESLTVDAVTGKISG